MPLHLIAECCKCHCFISQDIWTIRQNHGYSGKKFFVVILMQILIMKVVQDFQDWGWRNKITIKACYKTENSSKIIISRTFYVSNTEYEDYQVFSDKVVFHARISDFMNSYPTIGNNRQNEIEYKENLEHERLERLRREQQRREVQLRLF